MSDNLPNIDALAGLSDEALMLIYQALRLHQKADELRAGATEEQRGDFYYLADIAALEAGYKALTEKAVALPRRSS
jgi:hypothetical protein